MAENYFITGAQGCIGSWIVKALAERGDSPVVFDRSDDRRRLSAIMEPADLERVRFITGDITDAAAVHSALLDSAAQRVIHLAGLQVPACKADPVAGALVNVVGTLTVFDAARATGVKRVVYASSAAVYGIGEGGAPLDETATCEPATHYGVFKRANEGNAHVYFIDHGLSSVGLRPLTVYGVNRDAGLTSDPTKAMKAAVLGRTFVSPTALEAGLAARWESDRPLVATADVSGLSKADLPENDALPAIDVDSETFAVRVDGELIEPSPVAELPMTQRYFLF